MTNSSSFPFLALLAEPGDGNAAPVAGIENGSHVFGWVGFSSKDGVDLVEQERRLVAVDFAEQDRRGRVHLIPGISDE
jgi:hypothetical protein